MIFINAAQGGLLPPIGTWRFGSVAGNGIQAAVACFYRLLSAFKKCDFQVGG